MVVLTPRYVYFFLYPRNIVIPTKPLDELRESNSACRDLQFWPDYTISCFALRNLHPQSLS